MPNSQVSLTALSPLDGRYTSHLHSVADIFSEYALIRERLFVEVEYIVFLSSIGAIPKIPANGIQYLKALHAQFNLTDAEAVKEIEQTTKHDVKAVEYFIVQKLSHNGLEFGQFVHLGLTSEDTNSMATGLQLSKFQSKVLLPKLKEVLRVLTIMSEKHKKSVMIARTHGQAAVPTTMGKEMMVFAQRLMTELQLLEALKFEAKMSGAVGNYNAHVVLNPDIHWIDAAHDFITSLGLEPNHYSTQIVPPESYIRFFNSIQRINGILLDLTQDMWRYISDGLLLQKAEKDQVGSSTMPQKINPIDFENCEGNLGISNSLLTFLAQKLPVSRLQRDLSDSTVKRNFGVALAHSILAYQSLLKGLQKIECDTATMASEVDTHWELVAEAFQVLLRSRGVADGFERLRIFSQGKKPTAQDIEGFISSLNCTDEVKSELRSLTPTTYVGLAQTLVTQGNKKITSYLQGEI